ncbi:MAG: MoaD/ThiS family protein [Oscillospiraceae bacterium]|nr:MoaD/ThiS family protein [Oscillospiraceae bacterium]
MIKVKLFGLLRLNSGLKEAEIEAADVKTAFQALTALAPQLSVKELSRCVVFINGKQGSKRSKLKDGDEVTILSPVAGG